jgi:hypothetical protein
MNAFKEVCEFILMNRGIDWGIYDQIFFKIINIWSGRLPFVLLGRQSTRVYRIDFAICYFAHLLHGYICIVS